MVRDKPKGSAGGLDDGQVSRSVILQAALRIIDRDGALPAHIEQGGTARRCRGDRARATMCGHRRSGLGGAAAQRGPRLPPVGAGTPKRGAAIGDSAPGHAARPAATRNAAPTGGRLGAVAMLEKDPLPDATIDPAEVQRVNWQSAFVRLSRASQHSKRKSLRLSASCHAAKLRWPRLGPPSRAYRRAFLSETFQTSSSCFAEEIYQPSLTP